MCGGVFSFASWFMFVSTATIFLICEFNIRQKATKSITSSIKYSHLLYISLLPWNIFIENIIKFYDIRDNNGSPQKLLQLSIFCPAGCNETFILHIQKHKLEKCLENFKIYLPFYRSIVCSLPKQILNASSMMRVVIWHFWHPQKPRQSINASSHSVLILS